METSNSPQTIADSVCQVLSTAGDFVGKLDDHPLGAAAFIALVAICAIVTVAVLGRRQPAKASKEGDRQ